MHETAQYLTVFFSSSVHIVCHKRAIFDVNANAWWQFIGSGWNLKSYFPIFSHIRFEQIYFLQKEFLLRSVQIFILQEFSNIKCFPSKVVLTSDEMTPEKPKRDKKAKKKISF